MKDSREQSKLIDTINLNPKGIMSPIYIGRSDIYVYSNEGTIPHFHLVPKNGIGESCICIYEPFYFNHGSKQMQLNSKQRKLLDDWMYLKPSLFPEINNWELISRLWQIDNGNKYIPNNPAKPNYRNMISSID